MLLRLTLDEFEWDDWNGESNLECSSQTRKVDCKELCELLNGKRFRSGIYPIPGTILTIESQSGQLAIPGAISASVQPPMDLNGNPSNAVYVNGKIAVFD